MGEHKKRMPAHTKEDTLLHAANHTNQHQMCRNSRLHKNVHQAPHIYTVHSCCFVCFYFSIFFLLMYAVTTGFEGSHSFLSVNHGLEFVIRFSGFFPSCIVIVVAEMLVFFLLSLFLIIFFLSFVARADALHSF